MSVVEAAAYIKKYINLNSSFYNLTTCNLLQLSMPCCKNHLIQIVRPWLHSFARKGPKRRKTPQKCPCVFEPASLAGIPSPHLPEGTGDDLLEGHKECCSVPEYCRDVLQRSSRGSVVKGSTASRRCSRRCAARSTASTYGALGFGLAVTSKRARGCNSAGPSEELLRWSAQGLTFP